MIKNSIKELSNEKTHEEFILNYLQTIDKNYFLKIKLFPNNRIMQTTSEMHDWKNFNTAWMGNTEVQQNKDSNNNAIFI